LYFEEYFDIVDVLTATLDDPKAFPPATEGVGRGQTVMDDTFNEQACRKR